MISMNHVRAARALLGWSQDDLSRESGVSIQTIKRMESKGFESCKFTTYQDVMKAFEKAGVTFTPGGPQLFAGD